MALLGGMSLYLSGKEITCFCWKFVFRHNDEREGKLGEDKEKCRRTLPNLLNRGPGNLATLIFRRDLKCRLAERNLSTWRKNSIGSFRMATRELRVEICAVKRAQDCDSGHNTNKPRNICSKCQCEAETKHIHYARN